ncbi:MAG: MASE1 domain-containing protein [Phycisphaerales bacterium]|nr:MASE1 domain-containing protein [Phycisphaerales bacterium]
MDTLTPELRGSPDTAWRGRAVEHARYAARLAAFVAIYYVIARLSLRLALVQGNAAPVWPATGVSLAAILLGGYRMWPGIAVGVYLATAWSPAGPWTSIGLAAGNTLEAVTGAYLLRWWTGGRVDLGRVRDVVGLIVLAGFVATAVSALVGALSLLLLGNIPREMFHKTLLVWWAGNISGCILVAPLVLSWREWTPRRPREREVGEALLITTLVVLVCELEFGFLALSGATAYSMAFALFPPLVWAALRFGPRGASTTAFVISLLAVIATVAGLGPFARQAASEAVSIAMLSLFSTTLGATGLLLSAAVTERQRAAQARLEAETRYRRLIEHASDAILLSAPGGRFVEANRRGLELLGCSSDELCGLGLEDVFGDGSPDRRPADREEPPIDAHPSAEQLLRRKNGTHVPVEISTTRLPDGGLLHVVRDVTERNRLKRRSDAERHVLELLAKGEPLASLLNHLALESEKVFPGMMCSVLLLDASGTRLMHGAAPSLPDEYCRIIDGVEIGPHVGSCGTAAYTRETVVATDILTDFRWHGITDLASRFGLRACFSVPILSSRGRVLGTFANYYRTPHVPQPAELETMQRSAYLASLAIERKIAEEHRQLMIRELDHRVKNNLSVVLSIADQTAQSVESLEEFSERFASRVKALARVHALLANSLWRKTDLGTLITRTLLPHLTSDPSRIRVRGEPCEIPARAAGPLCMTLHELATNAIKHGALSVPDGEIVVEWIMRTSETGEPEVAISWAEHGGPPVREPQRTGFGVQLIRSEIAHDIRARVRLEFKPEGVWCELAVPLREEPTVGEPAEWIGESSRPG